MMRNLSQYSAITAKVRAMYGKRLRKEDYERICALKSVPEVADYLRTTKAWGTVMSSLPRDVHRGALEKALREQLQSEYMKVFRFSSPRDKEFISFLLRRIDYEQILVAIRRLVSENPPHVTPDVPEMYYKYSTINYDALRNCTDYPGLLASVRNSIYYEPLRSIMPSDKSGLPDYTRANVILQSTYYEAIIKYISKHFSGSVKKLLLKSVGEEIDLLNILHILRIKKYFPESGRSPTDIVFPLYYKLSTEFFQKLAEAPGEKAALNVIRSSYYGKHFAGHGNFQYLEQYYSLWEYTFNRKQLLMGPPSIYVPLAYLTLKELDSRRLISAVESIRYGIPVANAPVAF